jgi:hypothetical protein
MYPRYFDSDEKGRLSGGLFVACNSTQTAFHVTHYVAIAQGLH